MSQRVTTLSAVAGTYGSDGEARSAKSSPLPSAYGPRPGRSPARCGSWRCPASGAWWNRRSCRPPAKSARSRARRAADRRPDARFPNPGPQPRQIDLGNATYRWQAHWKSSNWKPGGKVSRELEVFTGNLQRPLLEPAAHARGRPGTVGIVRHPGRSRFQP